MFTRKSRADRRARALAEHMREQAIARARDDLYATLRRIAHEHPCDHPQCAQDRAGVADELAKLDALTGDTSPPA